MRKILLLISLVLLGSCSCLLSQVPPQYVYITDSTCMAPLPDYRTKVTASDNCGPVTLTQDPEPGFILGYPGARVEVKIRATDNSKNYKQIKFYVTLLDTIPPIIDSTLLTVDTEMERIEYLYNKADLAVLNKMEEFDATFPYEQFGIVKDDVDSTFYKKMMFISVPTAHAITGKGNRFWQWQNPGDTIIIYNHY